MTNALLHNGLFGNLLRDAKISDAFSTTAFLDKMMAFELAWTAGLAAVGAVSQDDADGAIAHLSRFEFDLDDLARGSGRDGIPVPAMIAQLKAGQAPNIKAAIHTGTTSQDVIDTAMVLTLRDVSTLIATRLQTVIVRLDRLDETFGKAALMGRTRMQAARPITVAHRIAAWRSPLQHHLDWEQHLPRDVQIGGAVGLRDHPTGQGDAMATYVAQQLGLGVGPVWHTDRSAMLDFGHWLTRITGSLGKLGQDAALMAQQGVDDAAFSGGGASSAMPHKQNPIMAESLVTLARYTAAQSGGLAQAMLHEQERSGSAWALEWMILPAMCEATGAALNNALTLLDQVTRLGQPKD